MRWLRQGGGVRGRLSRALGTSEVDQVELSLGRVACLGILAREPHAKDVVGARGVLVAFRRGSRAHLGGSCHERLELVAVLDARAAQAGHCHHAIGVRDLELARSGRAAATLSGQEVAQLVVVNLQEGGRKLKRPTEELELLGGSEDLLRGARHHAARLAAGTLHRERLSRAGLTVGEDAHLVAVDGRLRQLRDLMKDVRLRRGLTKDAIKLEALHRAFLAAPIARRRWHQLQVRWLQLAGRHARRRRVVGRGRGGRGRAHAAVDTDVALELGDGLVHLAAQLLLGAAAASKLLDVGLARRDR